MAFTYILPDAMPAPPMDDELEDILQRAFAGITGMDPRLVRPRFEPEPANMPDFSQTWASFGVGETQSDLLAFLRQVSDDVQELQRDQQFTALASFYGPGAQVQLERFRDGIQIQQNREELGSFGIKLVEVGQARRLPALVKGLWQDRRDVPVILRRRYTRLYRVAAVNSADLGLDNEFYVTPIVVTPPTP
ncbi:hypothetical protein D3C87_795820 [compost metagenome]